MDPGQDDRSDRPDETTSGHAEDDTSHHEDHDTKRHAEEGPSHHAEDDTTYHAEDTSDTSGHSGHSGGSGGSGREPELYHLIERMRSVVARAESITLDRDKGRIGQHLQEKLDALSMRVQIMRLKYASVQRVYARISMSIIVISSVAAVVETVKGELNLNNPATTHPDTYHFMQLFPAIVSAVIGLLASITKFCKFAERTEALGRCVELTVSCMSRASRLQETVAAQQNLDDLDSLAQAVADTLDDISATTTVIASNLKYQDIVTYMPTYHALALHYLQEEQDFHTRTREIVGQREVDVPDGPRVRGGRAPLSLARRPPPVASSVFFGCFPRRRQATSLPV